ncbi:hypothetical protein, partial [Nocardia sp. NPDC051570]|uniref:hypothetical protein n=1 Tax=Nocardia sp. NPDC051570 TaxID=3364324 RepID=UPI0037BDD6D1
MGQQICTGVLPAVQEFRSGGEGADLGGLVAAGEHLFQMECGAPVFGLAGHEVVPVAVDAPRDYPDRQHGQQQERGGEPRHRRHRGRDRGGVEEGVSGGEQGTQHQAGMQPSRFPGPGEQVVVGG